MGCNTSKYMQQKFEAKLPRDILKMSRNKSFNWCHRCFVVAVFTAVTVVSVVTVVAVFIVVAFAPFKLPFFLHSALNFWFCRTTGKSGGKNIDKRRVTDLHLRTKGDEEVQALFSYSDLSSEIMLVLHILFINLTG